MISNEPDTNSKEENHLCSNERWRIWKNVFLIGLSFMVHFTAFWGASNLQSSINAEAALGTITLAATYGSLIISNTFLPVLIIEWIGTKWTIAISLITYMPFILSQFYPSFYTMIPAAIAMGLGGAPLWCAKCTYLTVISEAYSELTGMNSEISVTRFFGIFFMFYSSSQVWGNLISSAVLSSGSPHIDLKSVSVSNATQVVFVQSNLVDVGERCGANFCPTPAEPSVNPNLKLPPSSKINLVFGIYLGCMIVACLIVMFGVDQMSRYSKHRKSSGSGLSGKELLAVTLKQFGNMKQILIIPITMFIGAEQAYIAADYTSAFVSCSWGISNIGFVMICFGVCNAVASVVSGSVAKITGRTPVVCFALLLHIALLITLLFWRPSGDKKIIYFVISGLWGVCDALWLVQINTLYGILFSGNEEAAYSNFRICEAVGSVITYACSSYLCQAAKLYLLLGLLGIGVIGYAGVHMMKDEKSPCERSPITRFELQKAKDLK
ncbi:unnamed protein product [Phaedon cochleariae]|uniref:UNC93-like protein n=1 Tax=Phaedon cochleariae TaxID=80249 RepID=A0A9P0DMP1_PHACE|nr:unnamed protein product [Phaedon cochleariae]